MSKCIKCGRELTSAEIPEFYNGMCEKCCKELNCAEYPFKQGINDYQNQIDQLKQQLAEKDKEIERLKFYETAYYYNQLQASEDTIKKLFQSAYQNPVAVNQTQLAIQELAEVERLLYESHYREIDGKYYAEYEDIKNLIYNRIKGLERRENDD